MHITVEKEIVVERPVQQVWKTFIDVNNWPKVFPNVIDSKIDGNLEVGKKFIMVLKGTIPFMPLHVEPTVLDVQENKLLRWRGSGKLGIKGVHDFIFQTVSKADKNTKGTSYSSTKIISREVFTGKLVFLALPLRSRVEKSFEVHLQGFKKYMEGRVP